MGLSCRVQIVNCQRSFSCAGRMVNACSYSSAREKAGFSSRQSAKFFLNLLHYIAPGQPGQSDNRLHAHPLVPALVNHSLRLTSPVRPCASKLRSIKCALLRRSMITLLARVP